MPAKTYEELMTRDNVDRLDYAIKLGKFGKPAVDYLIKAMKHEDLWIRYLMIDALGNSGLVRQVWSVNPVPVDITSAQMPLP